MTSDIVVIGGGIVGLTIAAAAKRRFSDSSVTLLEKEPRLGLHASGRNSGVLHAGFYYSDDSLKARFSRDGNRRLTEYCVERGLRINRCGKLVVAQSESDLHSFRELERRAQINEVEIRSLSVAEVREIEPRAKTLERALFSPTTSAVDPVEVVTSLGKDAEAIGVRVQTGVRYISAAPGVVRTSVGDVNAGYVINAAGLQADDIAHQFGIGLQYRILPFKGLYLYGEPGEALRTNVYPVPALANPFVGVHFTVTVDGRVKIGPTATPAFWREQYGWSAGFSAREFAQIVTREMALLVRNDFSFRTLALAETRKYSRRRLVAMASRLVAGVEPARYRSWGRPGIRAQLFDTSARRLVMDFAVAGDDRSFHVLNAVSPAFTCALPFADYVVEKVSESVR